MIKLCCKSSRKIYMPPMAEKCNVGKIYLTQKTTYVGLYRNNVKKGLPNYPTFFRGKPYCYAFGTNRYRPFPMEGLELVKECDPNIVGSFIAYLEILWKDGAWSIFL